MRIFPRRERHYRVVVNGRAMTHPLDESTIRALWPDVQPDRGHYHTRHGDRVHFERIR